MRDMGQKGARIVREREREWGRGKETKTGVHIRWSRGLVIEHRATSKISTGISTECVDATWWTAATRVRQPSTDFRRWNSIFADRTVRRAGKIRFWRIFVALKHLCSFVGTCTFFLSWILGLWDVEYARMQLNRIHFHRCIIFRSFAVSLFSFSLEFCIFFSFFALVFFHFPTNFFDCEFKIQTTFLVCFYSENWINDLTSLLRE